MNKNEAAHAKEFGEALQTAQQDLLKRFPEHGILVMGAEPPRPEDKMFRCWTFMSDTVWAEAFITALVDQFVNIPRQEMHDKRRSTEH